MGRTNGFHGGNAFARRFPVTTDSAIKKGEMLGISRQTVGGVANTLCLTPISAGDKPFAVAAEPCAKPSAHGALDVLAYTSEEAIFDYPPDSGTVDGSLVGKTCDTGGSQSIDIDASTDDVIQIIDVDTVDNRLYVKIKFSDTYVGVV